jgi:anaerobic nitric oxide reductase flavorubredoxin
LVSVKLREAVHWVGAIDWGIRDFQDHHTPRGSSYNAYLILDEKKVLVDTVKAEFANDLIGNIKELVDPGYLDYVVVNHVEMDHSGSLKTIMNLAKNAKIVCSEKGWENLTKHYGGNWEHIIVKTGMELKIGKRTLKFIEAPMLHWPDSMFTYVKEDKILLPNDAFGQHIATAFRFDDENGEEVMDEASKYFANILMPFSGLIPGIVEKLKEQNIDFDMIGPSHGVIWRSHIDKILGAYVKWSSGVVENKIVVVYDTMWGSTEKMARAITEGIVRAGMNVRLFNLRKSDQTEILKEVLESKAVLIGSPTLNNGLFPSVAGFLTYMKGLRPKNKIGLAFGSYGWGRGAVTAIERELKATGFTLEPSLEVQFVPDEVTLAKCVALGTMAAVKFIGVRNFGGETTQKPEEKPATKSWRCLVCGYTYAPEKGDPDRGIPPGTRFEDLPANWTCPACNASKEQFEEVKL